jgi:hypothetical protein
MARLFLHVGTSKAGSTAFQELMVRNRRQLSAHGLDYGTGLRGPNHLDLALAFCTPSTRMARTFGVQGDADRRRLRQAMGRGFRKACESDGSWVVSSEHLSTLLKRPADIVALADYLSGYFSRISVLFVLRRVGYWLPSAYIESVRGGSVRLLDAGYAHQRRRLLHQRELVQRWQHAFRTDRVAALPFLEADKSNAHALPYRLLQAMGISSPEEVAWSTPPAVRNESMSAYATEVLRTVNPMIKTSALRSTKSRTRVISYVTATWPGAGIALTPEAAEALKESEADDIDLAQEAFAVGADWSDWASQPPAPTRPQLTLTEGQREDAMRRLSQARMIDGDGAGPATVRKWTARLAQPFRRVWHHPSRLLRRS